MASHQDAIFVEAQNPAILGALIESRPRRMGGNSDPFMRILGAVEGSPVVSPGDRKPVDVLNSEQNHII